MFGLVINKKKGLVGFMQFKEWLLTEEIWPNNTATVYHRTRRENIKGILSEPFKGYGDGGFYSTFDIESQFNNEYMQRYGETLVKLKVTNLDEYIITYKNVAMNILGEKYKISDQIKRLNLTDLYTKEQIEKFDKDFDKNREEHWAVEQDMLMANKNLMKRVKGIISWQPGHGYVLWKFPPIEDGTITILGYAYASVGDFKLMKELMSNCRKNSEGKCENPWITSTGKVSIKTLHSSKRDDKSSYLDKHISNVETLKKINKRPSDIKNLTDKEVDQLFINSKDKNAIAKLIIQFKDKLTNKNINDIMFYTNNIQIIRMLNQVLDSYDYMEVIYHILKLSGDSHRIIRYIRDYSIKIDEDMLYDLIVRTKYYYDDLYYFLIKNFNLDVYKIISKLKANKKYNYDEIIGSLLKDYKNIHTQLAKQENPKALNPRQSDIDPEDHLYGMQDKLSKISI